MRRWVRDCNIRTVPLAPAHHLPPPTCFSLLYLACHCHPQGSKSTVCDQITGQCPCQEEVAGLHWDQCLQVYFGFPSCHPCLCNSFAELCNPEIGSCFSCWGFTTGRNCERYGIHMYFYFLIFFFCSDFTTLLKGPLSRNSTVFKCRMIALGGEGRVSFWHPSKSCFKPDSVWLN